LKVSYAIGPPELSEEDVRKMRYDITSLVDDMRVPRSRDELVATGAELHQALANYYLRTNNLWSGTGKSIPESWDMWTQTCVCATPLHSMNYLPTGRSEMVVALAEHILNPTWRILV